MNGQSTPPIAGGFKTSGSGISTNTILLSRKKMGMTSIPKQQEVPTPAPVQEEAVQVELPLAEKMSDSMVWCPKCECGFEITDEFYGIQAECSECAMEFKLPDAPTISSKPTVVAPPRSKSGGYRKSAAKKVKKKSNTGLYITVAAIIVVLVVIIATQI